MKGDFSRSTFDALKHYIGVRIQQGRVTPDADFNENLDILLHRIETETIDVIGECGVPVHDAAFGIVTDNKTLSKEEQDWLTKQGFTSLASGDFYLTKGRAYVDGIQVENDNTLPFSQQPFVLPPGKGKIGGAGRYLVYLDVWPRHITALEDPSIREVALGGPDTATRMQTIWQAVLKKVGDDITCADDLTDWPPESSQGKLMARTHSEDQPGDPCTVPPGAGYKRLENQLYRVEIHTPGGSGGTGKPTFKWSRDNGSVVVSIVEFSVDSDGTKIRTSSLGRDDVLGLHENDWVEVSDDASELAGLPGTIAKINKIDPDNILTLSKDVSSYDLKGHPKVRRWDSEGDIPVTVPAENDGYIKLEGGVEIKFEIDTFHTGDYWLIPARTVPGQFGDIEWPQESGKPAALLPFGILHHYCKLAVLTAEEQSGKITITKVDDCRKKFPPLTELPAGGQCCCSVSVGQGGDYPDIQSALVARPKDAVEWRICLLAGEHQLKDTIAIDNAQGLTISGCGKQTRVIGPQGMPVFVFTDGNGVRLDGLWLEASSPDGAILFKETIWVVVSDCVLVNNLDKTSGKGISFEDLEKLSLGPLIVMSEAQRVEVRENHLIGLPSVRASGWDLSIVRNRIRGGGIQIVPPSSVIRIDDNLISEGNAPGIRLGADEIAADSAVLTKELYMDDTGTGQLVVKGGSVLTGIQLVNITHNLIARMAGSGIVTQDQMNDPAQMIDVEYLTIRDNQIIACCSIPDIFLDLEVGVSGGIALISVFNTQIADNLIAWNGEGKAPACGIFLLEGGGIDVHGNVIVENGVAAYESGSDFYQAGIAAHFMVGDLLGSAVEDPGLRGYPAMRVHDNEVVCPAGQALTVSALGGVTVDGNTFVTRARKQLPSNPLRFGEKGACVYILDLGVPNWLKELTQ